VLLLVFTLVARAVLTAGTVLVLMFTRRARVRLRDTLRVLWVLVIAGVAGAALYLARALLLAKPDIDPMVPGALRLAAILAFCEAYLVSSFVWLPRVFDWFEGSSAGMMLAVRQLRARKSGFLTVISFFGVGLSSCGLCTTISVMGGFGNDLKRKILGNNAHVVVDRDRDGFGDWRPLLERIQRVPGVTSATPLVQGEVMITSQTNLSGVLLRGIEAEHGGAASTLSRELIRGRLAYLGHPERLLTVSGEERRPVTSRESDDAQGPAPGPTPVQPQLPPGIAPLPPAVGPAADVLPGVIVGRELASNLRLSVGDEVRVVSPFGGMVTPAGTLPKTRLFRVAGIFYSGMYEYDTKYAYVTIPVAQNFFNFQGDQISSIEVRVDDVDRADTVARQIEPIVAPAHLRVRDWKQLNQNLFRALALEKLMMFVLLGVAIVVASFAIVATLLLLVIEKGREIAVLKAMGASDPFIARVFVFVGLLIGLVGSTLGVSTALVVCSLIQKLGIPLDPEVYYIDRLPVFISLSDYVFVTIIAVMVCLVATLYPAWAASRLQPVDGMRFG
jgi:lipoprotein-releasing system permease protein